MGIKVYLVEEVLAHYRVPVFARLSQFESIELTVFSGRHVKGRGKEGVRQGIMQGEFVYRVLVFEKWWRLIRRSQKGNPTKVAR